MNFDDIKDRIRDQFNALWGRIQESTAFNTLKEQYESWPVVAQRSIAFGAGALAVLVVLSIPFSYISAANTSIEEFNEYRLLLRDLLRVGRVAKEPPPLPPGLSSSDLQSQIQAIMGEFGLLPEQISGTRPLEDRPAAQLSPPVINQSGVAVALKKLNLNQVVDIGFRFQNINIGTKLTGVEILANSEDNHFFDVTYKLVSFALPVAEEDQSSNERGGGSGGGEDDR